MWTLLPDPLHSQTHPFDTQFIDVLIAKQPVKAFKANGTETGKGWKWYAPKEIILNYHS